MADTTEKKDATPPTLQHRLLNWLEKQFGIIAITGLLGYVVWALADDDEARGVFLQGMRLTRNLFIEARDMYERLRRGLMAVATIVVMHLLWMLYMGYHMGKVFAAGQLFHTISHSRGIVELLAGLILFALLGDFSTRVLPGLFGADFINRRLTQGMPGEGYLEKFLRLVGKFSGWVSLGIVLLTITPWHNDPRLLIIVSTTILIWPFFCNAWKPGQSEHFRRTLLWLNGLLNINLIMLAALKPAISVAIETSTNKDLAAAGIGLAMFIAWVLQAIFAIYMGTRSTVEDKTRRALAPLIVADQVRGDLKNPDEAARLLSLAGIKPQTEVHIHQVQMTGGAPSAAATAALLRQYPQPRSKTGEHILILALVIVVAWCFMIFLHVDVTKFNPMISASWFFSSGWKLLLMVAGGWFILNYLFSRKSTNG